jgi:hypothetical protein
VCGKEYCIIFVCLSTNGRNKEFNNKHQKSISLYEKDTQFSEKENGSEKYKGSVVGDNCLYFPKNILSKAKLYIVDYGFF